MGHEEQWKQVDGFPHYEVSNFGRVRSFPQDGLVRGRKTIRYLTGTSNQGYIRVSLSNGKLKKREYVHRLVANAFIDNPEHKRCINHKDNDRANNHSDNLEWCTHQENTDWMAAQGRNKRTQTWLDHLHNAQKKGYKPVIATNVHSGKKLYFDYLNAVREHGFQPSQVCACCKGRQQIHQGYKWEYA